MIRFSELLARLKGWRRAGLLMVSGMAAALSLPPVGWWPALFVAFPVFVMLLAATPLTSWRSGLGTGWLFGFGYFAVAFHWIGFAFLVDAATYLWMMPFMLGALAGGMAIYWALAAAAALRLGGGSLSTVLMLAAFLGFSEWLRGHLFTGFPWAAPGLAADAMGPLAQLAAVVGMTGLTVLLVMWAGMPAVLLLRQGRQCNIIAIGLLLLLPAGWGLGASRLSGAGDAIVPDVKLRIVQPNIGQQQKWREDNARSIFETLKRLSAEPSRTYPNGIGDITLLVWPESAVPFFIDESPVARTELKPLLGGKTSLVTGSLRREGEGDGLRVFNSMIIFDGEAEVAGRYDKWRLVPGGEFLPFAALLEPLGFRKVVTVPGSFEAGPGARTMRIPGAPSAAMLVCYEAIFPHHLIDEAERPGFIINVTNDGWFGNSTGPYQHLAQLRMRTIEQGLPAVRSANTGISAVIDAYGRTLHALPLQQAGVIDSGLPAAIDPPAYARWGELLPAFLVFAMAAMGLLLRKPQEKHSA